MPKPRPLTPGEARASLVHRMSRVADNARQLATKFGLRNLRVFLIWSRWTGQERGAGDVVFLCECEILPTPRVSSLDAVSFSTFGAGVIPVGSIQVDRITARMTFDQLRGCIDVDGNMSKIGPRGEGIPPGHLDHIPDPYDFFWEVREDGRGDCPAQRWRYRLMGTPFRRPGKVDWTCRLEREDQDRMRNGQNAITLGTE